MVLAPRHPRPALASSPLARALGFPSSLLFFPETETDQRPTSGFTLSPLGSYASWGQDRGGALVQEERARQARAPPRKPRPGAFAGEQASLPSRLVACSPYSTAPRQRLKSWSWRAPPSQSPPWDR